jgi:hypothetical protein
MCKKKTEKSSTRRDFIKITGLGSVGLDVLVAENQQHL